MSPVSPRKRKQERLHTLSEYLKKISDDELSLDKLVSLSLTGHEEQEELWGAFVRISERETQSVQFCEIAYYEIRFSLSGVLLGAKYIRPVRRFSNKKQ